MLGLPYCVFHLRLYLFSRMWVAHSVALLTYPVQRLVFIRNHAIVSAGPDLYVDIVFKRKSFTCE
jgi:hypothetical protein